MDKILLSRAFFVNSQGDLLHMEKSFPLKRDLPNLKARSKFIGEIIFHVGTILVTLVYQIIVSAHLFISIHFPPVRFLFDMALSTWPMPNLDDFKKLIYKYDGKTSMRFPLGTSIRYAKLNFQQDSSPQPGLFWYNTFIWYTRSKRRNFQFFKNARVAESFQECRVCKIFHISLSFSFLSDFSKDYW